MSDDQMMREHQESYNGFVKLGIYSTVFVIVVLALMAIFLV